MRHTLLLFLIFGFALTSCGQPSAGQPTALGPALGDYDELKTKVEGRRTELAGTYAAATTKGERQKCLEKASEYVITVLPKELFPHWYGTEWDFYGTTQVPRQGQIACGYFVTTLLRDAGFRVERVRMAQQASLNIIRSLSPKEERWDWSHISTAQFSEKVSSLPKGIYVVGLDIHTGFILHDKEGVWFIHSSYGNPNEVLREKAAKSEILAQSNRFVLGRVNNDWLMEKWLKGEGIETVR